MHMLLVYLVRHENQFGIRALVYVTRQELFIFRPRATGYDDPFATFCKSSDGR